jgi:hypothetical protein
MEQLDDPAIMRRAFVAWYSADEAQAPGHPSPAVSHHVRVAGHEYVVLRAGRSLLAAYRLRNDGKLKRLRRWPRELND